MSFKEGDSVVCIKSQWNTHGEHVFAGAFYIIKFIADGEEYIALKDMDSYFPSKDFELVRIEAASTASIPTILENGAAKNDKEKPDLSLIPRISNIEHAKAFMVGEKKYGRYNYTKGHKSSQLIAAAKRHLDAWFEGEENDPIDGQHHLGSVMACCSMILRQQELNTLQDDRFKKEASG